jgi:hypothetical protein
MNSTTCPRCAGALQDAVPAISRADNSTRICATCGMAEALEVIATTTCAPIEAWPVQEPDTADWRAFRRALENGGAR